MMKFLYHYCLDYFGTDFIVIAVHPTWMPFYQAILTFERLSATQKAYDFVHGAPAVGAYLDLKAARDRFASVYLNKPDSLNIYKYFIEHEFDELRFPDRSLFKIDDPIMTPEIFKYFFQEKTDLLATFTSEQRAAIEEIYGQHEYSDVITTGHKHRRRQTIDLECDARIQIGANQFIQIRVILATTTELKVVSEYTLRIEQSYPIEIAIGKFDKVKLQVQVEKKTDDDAYWLSIRRDEPVWYNYIKGLSQERVNKIKKEVTVESYDGVISLKGQINEFSDFSAIEKHQGPILIDMSGVNEINSPGIILWINLMAKIKDRRVTLLECPIEFIHSVNMMPDLAPPPTLIESFRLPIRCSQCEKPTQFVVRTEDFQNQWPELPDHKTCNRCGGEMHIDVDEDYFNFLIE